MSRETPASFDPMNSEAVAHAVCREMEAQPIFEFGNWIESFDGSGLYAIYPTRAANTLYVPLVGLDIPVYVGKSSARASSIGKSANETDKLWKRVTHHRASITSVENLEIDDFGARLLIVPEVHAGLGEWGLIGAYKPVWNSVITGFGNNDPGKGRAGSKQSAWDAAHSGRNRTHGYSYTNLAKLLDKARGHIDGQVASAGTAPWRSK